VITFLESVVSDGRSTSYQMGWLYAVMCQFYGHCPQA